MDFALRADSAYLAQAAEDTTRFSDTSWGVPLTPGEAAELNRRGKVQVAIHDALVYASGLADYGGAYIDQARAGLPVIQFAGTSNIRAGEIRSRAPGIDIEFADVQLS